MIANEATVTLKNGDQLHSQPPADYGTLGVPIVDILADAGIDPAFATVHPASDGWTLLVLSEYQLPDGYTPNRVRLLVKLPPTYPDAAPDMFWVIPAVRAPDGITTALDVARAPARRGLAALLLAPVGGGMAGGREHTPRLPSVHRGSLSSPRLRRRQTMLRLLQSHWAPFVAALCTRTDVETAGLRFVEQLHGADVLIARDLVLVPDDGYLIRRVDQLRIDPVVFNRLVRRARDRGWGVFTVHTHPSTERPWFSAADDAGDARLIPSLLAQMPGPHGSVVVAGCSGAFAGRVWRTPSGNAAPLGTRLVGTTLQILPETSILDAASHEDSDAWFARQRLALGADGHSVRYRC